MPLTRYEMSPQPDPLGAREMAASFHHGRARAAAETPIQAREAAANGFRVATPCHLRPIPVPPWLEPGLATLTVLGEAPAGWAAREVLMEYGRPDCWISAWM
ncbi:hypothetical protein [Muricoccus radiodurans]|uniref:hypothetical protein n=1 Tax=Muricoccus radiodurans TaxID=2231721 RepID=UPI003CEF04F8